MVNTSWRIAFAIAALAYCAATGWYLMMYGDPTNSLHTSMLSWSAWIALSVLAGVGFGQITPQLAEVFKK